MRKRGKFSWFLALVSRVQSSFRLPPLAGTRDTGVGAGVDGVQRAARSQRRPTKPKAKCIGRRPRGGRSPQKRKPQRVRSTASRESGDALAHEFRRLWIPGSNFGHAALGLAAVSIAGFAVLSCKPKTPAPPPVASVGPEERILTVGTSWREMTRSEGFINEPDIVFMRVTDQFTLHIESSSMAALVDIEREELLRSPDGREFHCKVAGAIKASVRYAWRVDEATLTVHVPEASLPRSCRERGLSRPFKQFPALTATYALRGDQLVAVEPITLRSSLLPVD